MKNSAPHRPHNPPPSVTREDAVAARTLDAPAGVFRSDSVRASGGSNASASGAGDRGGGGSAAPPPGVPLDTCHQSEPTPCEGLETGFTPLRDLPKRIQRMGKGVADDASFASWLRDAPADPTGTTSNAERARRLDACGVRLEFHSLHRREGAPTRLHAGHFCHQHLLCTKCAQGRASRAVKAYAPKLAQEAAHRFPYLVTFTLPNREDLEAGFGVLRRTLTRLNYRRKHAQQRGTSDPLGLIDGYVGSFEFKRGKGSGLWHPHVHLIFLASRPLTLEDIDAIKAAWCEASREPASPLAQDIRPVVDADAILEVFKYALKLNDLTHDDRWSAFRTLTGRRLLISAGCLRGVEVPDVMEDDPFTDAELEEFLRIVYRRTPTGYAFHEGQLVRPLEPPKPVRLHRPPPKIPTIPPEDLPY